MFGVLCIRERGVCVCVGLCFKHLDPKKEERRKNYNEEEGGREGGRERRDLRIEETGASYVHIMKRLVCVCMYVL